jgi:toxin ParE1/3/4
MYKIQFTEPAEEDLISALRYISDVLKAPAAAQKLLTEIEEQLKVLENMPFSCPLVHDEYLAMKGIRFLIVNNYLLFYILKEEEGIVSVIRCLYARRDWARLLEANTDEDK